MRRRLPSWDELGPEAQAFALNSGVLTKKQLEVLRLTESLSYSLIASAMHCTKQGARDHHEAAIDKLYREMAK